MAHHHVSLLGPGHAPVMLLAHGFGTDQQSWAGLLPALAPTHRVVLLNQTGAGGFDASSHDRGRYSTRNGYAADLVEVCENSICAMSSSWGTA